MLIKRAEGTQAVKDFWKLVKKRWEDEGLHFPENGWKDAPKKLLKGGDAEISARRRKIVDELRAERLKKVRETLGKINPDDLDSFDSYVLDNRDAVSMLMSLARNRRAGRSFDERLSKNFTDLFASARDRTPEGSFLNNPNFTDKDKAYRSPDSRYRLTSEETAKAEKRLGRKLKDGELYKYIGENGGYRKNRVSPLVDMAGFYTKLVGKEAKNPHTDSVVPLPVRKISGVERLLGKDDLSHNQAMREIFGADNTVIPAQGFDGRTEPSFEFPWTKAIAGGAAGLAGLIGLHEILKDG